MENKIRALFFSHLVFVFFCGNLFAGSGADVNIFFSGPEKSGVLSGKIISRACLASDTGCKSEKILVPDSICAADDLSNYDLLVVEKAFIPYKLNRETKLKLYNILSAYSSLSGVSYYSVTDKRYQPFIIESRRIESPGNKNSAPSLHNGDIPVSAENYFLVEDNRFGAITFRSEIVNEGDNFTVKNTSVHPLNKFGFTVCNAGEYKFIFIFIYDKTVGGYYYYSLQALRIRSFFIRKLGFISAPSFANRLRAMTVHFAGLMGTDWQNRLNVYSSCD